MLPPHAIYSPFVGSYGLPPPGEPSPHGLVNQQPFRLLQIGTKLSSGSPDAGNLSDSPVHEEADTNLSVIATRRSVLQLLVYIESRRSVLQLLVVTS